MARVGSLAASRAPGMYLSIAYLVAFAIIVAAGFILRLLLFRRSGADGCAGVRVRGVRGFDGV